MDLVIDNGGDNRRGKIIFDFGKELAYLRAARTGQGTAVWQVNFNGWTGLGDLD